MSSLPAFACARRSISTVLSIVATVALMFLLVVDHEPGGQTSLVALALAALVALAVLHSASASCVGPRASRAPAEDTRLRGSFRRQHRPDTPGRPMPRAPGPAT
ncbi:MAG: DUF6412 domain-containing protein [Rhodococcus sp. (in: high G+C Gram-positive bacteria)]